MIDQEINKKKHKYKMSKQIDGALLQESFCQAEIIDVNANIFKISKQYDDGMKFDKAGKVIQRTIIGNAADFYKTKLLYNNTVRGIGIQHKKALVTMAQVIKNKVISQIEKTNEEIPLVKTHKQNGKIVEIKLPIKEEEGVIQNKLQLLGELQDKMKALKANEEQKIYIRQKKSIFNQQKVRVTRQDENFDRQQDVWKTEVCQLGNKIGRDPYDTLVSRSLSDQNLLIIKIQVFRQKMEEREAYVQPSERKEQWYESLRNNDNDHNQNVQTSIIKQKKEDKFGTIDNQLQSNSRINNSSFHHNSTENFQQQIEIIRPSFSFVSEDSRNQSYRQKSTYSKNLLPILNSRNLKYQSQLDELNLDNIHINGIQVIQKEFKSLQNDGNNMMTKYRNYFRSEKLEEEELICENWKNKKFSGNELIKINEYAS